MNESVPIPRWLQEEEWLQQLLHWFVDRLDAPRERAITRRVTKTTVPALYKFSEDTRYRWTLIEELVRGHQVFEVFYERVASSQVHYDYAQLRLNVVTEPLLRQWLDRPRIDPAQMAWREAIARHAERFMDGGASLQSLRPKEFSYAPELLANAFAAIDGYLDRALSLREISARCFRGDSKFLDHRQELLVRLYGERAEAIKPRPLLLTAFAPPGFDRLLIVENQDSFLRLADQKPGQTALLYSGGFRAAADRLVSDRTRFAFLPYSDPIEFRQRWCNPDLPAAFWGDLDFSGLGILAALRQSLPGLRAWKPGYEPMLEDLKRGHGHRPSEARKGAQVDPQITGCSYSDNFLLPGIRSLDRFIDQEAYLPAVDQYAADSCHR